MRALSRLRLARKIISSAVVSEQDKVQTLGDGAHMSAKNLKIDQLELDAVNPRISEANSQHEAMQRIIDDQDIKLGNLAESIVDDGLNPMDRLLVMKSEGVNGKYTVLEGNRRVAAMKILKNPAVLTGLEVRAPLQKKLEKLAQAFEPQSVEPIPCYEVNSRAEGNSWIEQRHTGEDDGRGIVRWSGVAASRFRGRDPALQALDFVLQHGNLADDQRKIIAGRFPITTLNRLLSTPGVRSRIGFEINEQKLLTSLPPNEAIKPLRRIVLDLAEKTVNVTKLKLKPQQLDYVSRLSTADRPNLAKRTGTLRPVESFSEHDFASKPKSKTKKAKTSSKIPRTTAIPKSCRLNIANPKIEEIYTELRALQLSKYPHAIAVLLRVFLETSIDHYLTKSGIPLTMATAGGERDKTLRKKVEECIAHIIAGGANKKDFKGISTALGSANHPFSPELLHAYVHNRFFSPTERDLTAAWDNGQPLFDRIWP